MKIKAKVKRQKAKGKNAAGAESVRWNTFDFCLLTFDF